MSVERTFSSGGRSIRLFCIEVGNAKPRPAIVLLHGSGGNIALWCSRLEPLLRQAGISLYAPHYFDRTGTSRAAMAHFTDGRHVPQWIETVHDTLRFVAALPTVDAQQLVLAGISLGGFLTMAVAAELSAKTLNATGTPQLRALVEISGGLVPPFEQQATAALPATLILHGTADTVVPVSFAHHLVARLTELQVPHRAELLDGEGHWFSPAALPRLLLAVSTFLRPLLQTG